MQALRLLQKRVEDLEALLETAISSSNYRSGIASLIYGSGQDGNATLDGVATFNSFSSLLGTTYTLTRDTFLSNLTINPGITLATGGFKLFVSSILTNNGIVSCDGKNAVLGVAGASSPSTGNPTLGIGVAGGNGRVGLGAGSNGGNQVATNTLGDAAALAQCVGGAGGAGGAQGGGLAGTYAAGFQNGGANYLVPMSTGFMFSATNGGNLAAANVIGGGAGGGGGGSDNAGITGGGGGGGGGVLLLAALNLVNNGVIRALGGNGAAASGAGGNGGGGGGGGGGIVLSTSRYRSGSGTVVVTGGLGGAGFGGAGAAGANGAVGHINAFFA